MTKVITIAIYKNKNSVKSAIYGLEEMFSMANNICNDQKLDIEFKTMIVNKVEEIKGFFNIILLPPSLQKSGLNSPETILVEWLKVQHQQGAILASTCAGAFTLAATSLLHGRSITTHWNLADSFKAQFPSTPINSNEILINHGDIISAGGMMSWLDLGFELIATFTSETIVQQLGKQLVIDTAPRKQCFYQQFNPSFVHKDQSIITIQKTMNLHYESPLLLIQDLAKNANLTLRTMQRRFLKATGYNPNHYLQKLRIQKACNYLQETHYSFDWIANKVGYEDTGACRKIFIKIMGLTPKEFRQRFARK